MKNRKRETGNSKPVNALPSPIGQFSVSCFRLPQA